MVGGGAAPSDWLAMEPGTQGAGSALSCGRIRRPPLPWESLMVQCVSQLSLMSNREHEDA